MGKFFYFSFWVTSDCSYVAQKKEKKQSTYHVAKLYSGSIRQETIRNQHLLLGVGSLGKSIQGHQTL